MLEIKNYRKATVCDAETDGLLDTVSKIYIVGYQMHTDKKPKVLWGDSEEERIRNFLKYHIDNEIPIVGHNFIPYDKPMFEKVLGMDLSNLMVIDTLAVSWYVNVFHKRHSLEVLGKDFDVAEKFQIDQSDWVKLTKKQAIERVTSDVEINKVVWEDMIDTLEDMYTLAKAEIDSGSVGGKRISEDEVLHIDSLVGLSVEEHVNRILTFLMFKMDVLSLQEKTGWHVDVPYLKDNIRELEVLVNAASETLEKVMPEIPEYTPRNKPTRPYKKNGELSKAGENWERIQLSLKNKEVDERGTPLVRVKGNGDVEELNGYKPPNINSHSQVKDFLFSHGWVPATFDFKRDDKLFEAWIRSKPKKGAKQWEWNAWKESRPEDRAIPQIRKDGDDGKELCESVEELAESVPEIAVLEEYTVIKHRLDTLKGMLDRVVDGKIMAGWHGTTNTLRVKHRAPVVNLPAANKKYAYPIRGSFVAPKGFTLIGSDMSSLENRVAHHFQMVHDPEYVETMLEDGYDGHILNALAANLITQEEFENFKLGIVPQHVANARAAGKTCLPTDTTEILTENGWMKFEDIKVGDLVLSLNLESGFTEMSPVVDTVFFPNESVEKISVGMNWEVESTADHRWVVDKRKFVNNKRVIEREYWLTKDLNSECNIVTSAPYVGGIGGKFTESDSRVLGWILSEGYLDASPLSKITSQGGGGERQAVVLSISQKGKFVGEIRDDLDKSGITFTESVRDDGLVIFKASSPSIRNWLIKVGLPLNSKHDTDYTKHLLSMSQKCLEGFTDTFFKGDGNVKTREKYSKTISQNFGNISKAVQLAYELLGRNTTVNMDSDSFCNIVTKPRGHVTMQRAKRGEFREVDVFCLTTGNGNFVIRQGNTITITGNCSYAATYGASPKAISRNAGVSLEVGEALHKGYWELNWSVNAVADEQVVIQCQRKLKWLVNPINGFCYSLRTDKDRWSTLCQGTGSYLFNMWGAEVLSRQYEEWGKKTQTAEVHDEFVYCVRDRKDVKDKFETFLKESVKRVSEKYNLRRELGCDVQFGKRYADIH